MKLLLDENLPKRLKNDFSGYQVATVREMKWNGVKDAELISLLKKNDFAALLTFDKNIRYQQNFKKSSVAVLILMARNNSYEELTKLSPLIRRVLSGRKLRSGPVAIYEGMQV